MLGPIIRLLICFVIIKEEMCKNKRKNKEYGTKKVRMRKKKWKNEKKDRKRNHLHDNM